MFDVTDSSMSQTLQSQYVVKTMISEEVKKVLPSNFRKINIIGRPYRALRRTIQWQRYYGSLRVLNDDWSFADDGIDLFVHYLHILSEGTGHAKDLISVMIRKPIEDIPNVVVH